MVREIPLTQGYITIIDDADFDRVSTYKWSVLLTGAVRKPYARRGWYEGDRFCSQTMHRLLMDLCAGDKRRVDHINGDGLDNRRCNLRIATPRQNAYNQMPQNSTGFKGVQKRGDFYFVTVEKRYFGTFDTAEEAARMSDAAATLVAGEFARTNFEDIDPRMLDLARRIRSGDKSALPRRMQSIQRLTDSDVAWARQEYAAGSLTIRQLADSLGVTYGCIAHALRGYTFRHITNPAPLTHDKRRKQVESEVA